MGNYDEKDSLSLQSSPSVAKPSDEMPRADVSAYAAADPELGTSLLLFLPLLVPPSPYPSLALQ